MTAEKGVRNTIFQERVLAAAGDGKRCAECFVHVLREDGIALPDPVEELAPFLEWGMGASGAACGVFVAAVLAGALRDGDARLREKAGAGSPPPAHEWLDAFTPQATGVDRQPGAAALAQRLATFASTHYGAIDCRSIAGVEPPGRSAALWGQFYSGGGAQRCTEFIVESARAFEDSIDAR